MKKRLCSLDLLKLVLTIIIVLHHFQLETGYVDSGVNFANGKIYFGYAVEFFFIISGYVLCMQIEKIKTQSFAQYMKNKIIRLYPMVVFSILANLIIIFIFYSVNGYWWRDLTPGIWKTVCSITLIFSGGAIRDVSFGLNNPIWYLCVLLICYIFVWCILFICDKYRINPYYWFAVVCIIGVATLQWQINLPFLNSQSARGYATFFLGMMLYKLHDRMNYIQLQIVALVVLVICVLLMVCNFDLFIDNQWAVFSFVLFPALLNVFLGLDKYMSSDIWNKLGEISFEVYLWHVNGIIILIALNSKYPTYFKYSIKSMLLFVLIMYVWAYIVYNCIEKPLTKYLRKKFMNEQK